MSKSTAARPVRRALIAVATVVTATAAVNGVTGYAIFSNAADSPDSPVDAVVVLGGEHDGRESYGVDAARRSHASTVVLSNPYPATDPVMKRMCVHRNDGVEVICVAPEPSTTRGEAMLTRKLAVERHWRRVLVLSWRYHLPRARLIFQRCLSGVGVSIAAKAVPRQYVLPVWYWQYIYLYQFTGIVKAVVSDPC